MYDFNNIKHYEEQFYKSKTCLKNRSSSNIKNLKRISNLISLNKSKNPMEGLGFEPQTFGS